MNYIEYRNFKDYIRSKGFIVLSNGIYYIPSYLYKYKIHISVSYYEIFEKYKCIGRYDFTDFKPVDIYFKRELRSVKLKQLLR